jgi:excisionase family DNA binding protein
MAKKAEKTTEIEEKQETEQEVEQEVKPEPKREEKLLSLFEAATYLGVTEGTIKLWIAHGHIRKVDNLRSACIPMESIRNFRLLGRKFTARGPVIG